MPKPYRVTTNHGTQLNLEKSYVMPGGLYAYLANLSAAGQPTAAITGHLTKGEAINLRDWLNAAYPPPPADNYEDIQLGRRAGAMAVAKALGQMLSEQADAAQCNPDDLLVSGASVARAVEQGIRSTGVTL